MCLARRRADHYGMMFPVTPPRTPQHRGTYLETAHVPMGTGSYRCPVDPLEMYLTPEERADGGRSVLDAALCDARCAMESKPPALCLATLGYLIVLEAIGTTVCRPNTTFRDRSGRLAFTAGAQEFAPNPVSPDQARALYAVRCSLAPSPLPPLLLFRILNAPGGLTGGSRATLAYSRRCRGGKARETHQSARPRRAYAQFFGRRDPRIFSRSVLSLRIRVRSTPNPTATRMRTPTMFPTP